MSDRAGGRRPPSLTGLPPGYLWQDEDESSAFACAATASAVMPKWSYSTSAGAEAPKEDMPTNAAFVARPRSPRSQRSQPMRTPASTATRTGPAGRTRLR